MRTAVIAAMFAATPSLRNDWQELGGDRFNEGNRNSMINCGPAIVNSGDSCFTYIPRRSAWGTTAPMSGTTRDSLRPAQPWPRTSPSKGDKLYLHLRLDFQNPFKWYNWGGPNTQLNVQSLANAALFGKINPGNNGETGTGTAGFGGTPLLNMTVALKW